MWLPSVDLVDQFLVSATPAVVYATKGSILTNPAGTNSSSTGSTWDSGDVWTTTDPGVLTGVVPEFSPNAADFGGATETISGAYNVSGTLDISNLSTALLGSLSMLALLRRRR